MGIDDKVVVVVHIPWNDKNYKKINIQLTTEELGILIGRIYEYTIKLAEDNYIKMPENSIQTDTGNDVIINLEKCLKIQKKIFEEAA